MKRKINYFLLFLFLVSAITGCGTVSGENRMEQTSGQVEMESGTEDEDTGMEVISLENFLMENGKTVYYYVPQNIKEHPEDKVPLVLFMCGTSCDPVDNVVESGWTALAEKENFIVISPDYNNYATYSETDFLISVVEYMIANYPVDCSRIYSTGFSNGGAASVALTRDYPEYFAAISAWAGWWISMTKMAFMQVTTCPFRWCRETVNLQRRQTPAV